MDWGSVFCPLPDIALLHHFGDDDDMFDHYVDTKRIRCWALIGLTLEEEDSKTLVHDKIM